MAKTPSDPMKHLRQSPLADLGLGARAAADADMDAGVTLAEHPFRLMVNLRGDKKAKAFLDGVKGATGLNPPTAVGTTAGDPNKLAIYCLGPDEWLVTAADGVADDLAETLTQALHSQHTAVTEVGEGFTVIALAGHFARDVLAKGCALDLHPKSFGPGRCAQTLLARADVLLHQTAYDRATDEGAYEIHVRRSFAGYLWAWLEDAGLEYDVKVSSV